MRVLIAALLLAGCAVKGYETGWRDDDALSAYLGRPLDALSGCRVGEHRVHGAAACPELRARLVTILATQSPASLGARCDGDRCSYTNRYERRDVGLATVLPIWRRTVMREARILFLRDAGRRWRLEFLSITDPPPPEYGPVRIGG